MIADEKKTLLVWLVSEPCRRIPMDMLRDVYTLSWQSLVTLTGSTEAGSQLMPCGTVDPLVANG